MHVKEQLLFLRKVGLTEKAIGHAIQAHQSTVSRILSGHIKDPRGSLLMEINHLFEKEKNKHERKNHLLNLSEKPTELIPRNVSLMQDWSDQV